MTYPARLGYWPAAAGLFAFVWQELVNPQSAYLGSVRVWLAGYLAIMLIGAAVFGDVWLERADPFEVYSSLLAKLSAWGRDGDAARRTQPAGEPRHRDPAARPGGGGLGAVRLDRVRQLQGHAPVAAVRHRRGPERGRSSTPWRCWSFCLVVGGTFTAAAMSTGVDTTGPDAVRRSRAARLLAHSVIPIVVGYMTAHYLSYLVEQGQNDDHPAQRPDGPRRQPARHRRTGTSTTGSRSTRSLLAVIQVLAVITGHICGVIAAHDRAISLLPKRHHVSGQIGMLIIMVAYTATGLYLLMGGGAEPSAPRAPPRGPR